LDNDPAGTMNNWPQPCSLRALSRPRQLDIHFLITDDWLIDTD
jgi:hypothetical protein